VAYVAAHPELNEQIAFIREDMQETVAVNEALPAAPAGALGRLMASVAAEQAAQGPVSQFAGVAKAGARSIWAQLGDLFSAPTPVAVRWAGAAAAVVLLAQAVALGTLLGGKSSTPGYETASGPASGVVAGGTRLLVQFKAAATTGAIAALLEDVGAEIVAGPRPGGAFVIRISDKVLDASAKNAMIVRLRGKSDVIGLVLPTE
jgi:hypothetical protein